MTEEPVIDFASLGFFSSTCVTNVGLLAKNGGILSVVCSSVANPIVPGIGTATVTTFLHPGTGLQEESEEAAMCEETLEAQLAGSEIDNTM